MKNVFKYTLLILFIIILIFIFFTNFNKFIKKNFENQNIANQQKIEEKQENQNKKEIEEKIKKISNYQAIDFIFNDNNIYYLSEIGYFYKIENGKEIRLNEENFYPIKKVSFSPKKEKALIGFKNPINPEWIIFDFLDKSWRVFYDKNKINILEAEWLEENKIIALIRKENEKFERIIKITINNTNVQEEELLDYINIVDINLIPVNENEILLLEKPSEDYKSNIWLINLNKKEIYQPIKPELGLILKKIKINQEIFFIKYSLENKKTILLNKKFEEISEITEDIINKCSFNENKIICFISKIELDLIKYLTKEQFSNDYILKIIDLKINEQNELKIEEIYKEIPTKEGFKIDAIKSYLINQKVIFINKYDNLLYEIKLD